SHVSCCGCFCVIDFTSILPFLVSFLFFFFQAEDGIRDRNVTGVQTLLFRSVPPASRGRRGRRRDARAPGSRSPRRCPRLPYRSQIGRASCREREEGAGGGGS